MSINRPARGYDCVRGIAVPSLVMDPKTLTDTPVLNPLARALAETDRLRAFGGHGLAYGGDDLAREELDLAYVILGGPVDEGVHPELQREARKLLDPHRGGAFERALALIGDLSAQLRGT